MNVLALADEQVDVALVAENLRILEARLVAAGHLRPHTTFTAPSRSFTTSSRAGSGSAAASPTAPSYGCTPPSGASRTGDGPSERRGQEGGGRDGPDQAVTS